MLTVAHTHAENGVLPVIEWAIGQGMSPKLRRLEMPLLNGATGIYNAVAAARQRAAAGQGPRPALGADPPAAGLREGPGESALAAHRRAGPVAGVAGERGAAITFSNYVDENHEILEPVARRPLRALRLSGFGLGLPCLCKLIHAMEHGRDGVLSQLERLDLGHNPDIGNEGVTMLVERAKEARREAQAGSGAVADWASGIRELVLDHVGLEGQGMGFQALAVGFQHHGIFPRLRTLWLGVGGELLPALPALKKPWGYRKGVGSWDDLGAWGKHTDNRGEWQTHGHDPSMRQAGREGKRMWEGWQTHRHDCIVKDKASATGEGGVRRELVLLTETYNYNDCRK